MLISFQRQVEGPHGFSGGASEEFRRRSSSHTNFFGNDVTTPGELLRLECTALAVESCRVARSEGCWSPHQQEVLTYAQEVLVRGSLSPRSSNAAADSIPELIR